MPRIRQAVGGAMGEVGEAANAAEEAAKSALAAIEQVRQHGIEIELLIPDTTRQKLQTQGGVGLILLKVLDACGTPKLRIRLGQPADEKD